MKNYKRVGKVAVVSLFIIAIAIIVAITIRKAIAAPLETYHTKWELVEEIAAEDGATFAAALALDANEGSFSSKPADAYPIPEYGSSPYVHLPTSPGGAWKFIFCGTDAPDETFRFVMVGWAHGNGPAQVICESNDDCVLGTQDVYIYPGGDAVSNAYWADTLHVDTTKWTSLKVCNSGNNQICELVVDLAGIEFVKFYRYNVGGGSEASTIGVYGRPY